MNYNTLFLIFSLLCTTSSTPTINSVTEFIKCVRGGKEYDAQKTKKYRYWTAAGIAGTFATLAGLKIRYSYWFQKPTSTKGIYPIKTAISQKEQMQLDQFAEHAVTYSKFNALKLLLRLHANVHGRNQKGETLLFHATTKEIAQLLIEHKVPLNETDNQGNTALMKAAQYGHLDVVTVLVDHGAHIKTKNDNGKTALEKAQLQRALCSAPEECVRYDTIITYLQNTLNTLDTNLIDAVKHSNLKNVTQFLSQGADPNVQIHNAFPLFYAKTKEVAQALITAGARVNAENSCKSTSLHEAALWGNADVVEVLLTNGANITIEDNTGSNAFYKACNYTDKSKRDQYKKIIELLESKMNQGTA